jgi:hypothetical protein
MERLNRMSVVAVALLLVSILGSPSVEAAQFTDTTQGFTLTYPDTWNAELGLHGRGVVLRNFPAERTPEGGFVPPGGAVISIGVYPPFDNPYFPQGRDDYSALDYMARNSKVIARTDPSSGQPARVTEIFDAANLRTVHTVRHVGARTFLLHLECLADDPQVPAYEQVLDSVIASISLTSVTPAPTTPTP